MIGSLGMTFPIYWFCLSIYCVVRHTLRESVCISTTAIPLLIIWWLISLSNSLWKWSASLHLASFFTSSSLVSWNKLSVALPKKWSHSSRTCGFNSTTNSRMIQAFQACMIVIWLNGLACLPLRIYLYSFPPFLKPDHLNRTVLFAFFFGIHSK